MSRPIQQIRFCTSRDGTRIAYASCGTGEPLIWAAHWVGHLQLSWDNQVWRPWLAMLMHRHTLIRYDARGCGLSDRDVADLSLGRHIEDLEAVAAAVGLDRFSLFGVAGGGAIAISYAARHPEHVKDLSYMAVAHAQSWSARRTPRNARKRLRKSRPWGWDGAWIIRLIANSSLRS